jgi:hypothetical protein
MTLRQAQQAVPDEQLPFHSRPVPVPDEQDETPLLAMPARSALRGRAPLNQLHPAEPSAGLGLGFVESAPMEHLRNGPAHDGPDSVVLLSSQHEPAGQVPPAVQGPVWNGSGRGFPAPSDARGEAQLVGTMAGKIGLAAVEVLAGSRPVHQLARWLAPASYEALQLRASLTQEAQRASVPGVNNVRQLHRNPLVRSVHCSPVRAGVYEASLVIMEKQRIRAVAMRLEQTRGAWKVTALEIG